MDTMDELPSGTEAADGDITLQALTQLGVYKFHCKRALVSITDGLQNERIIADASKNGSLSSNNLEREWKTCSRTTKLFSCCEDEDVETTDVVVEASRTRCVVVRDLTQEHNNGFGEEWRPELMRFYAAVPLRGPSGGHVLGTYCIVDDRTRDVFGENAVQQLQEVADAIAQHLANTLIVHRHHRSENLTRGLANFIEERSCETIQAQNAGRFDKLTIWDSPETNGIESSLYTTDSASEPSPTATSDLHSDSTETTSSYTTENGPITVKMPDSQKTFERLRQGRDPDSDVSPIVRESESEAVARRISAIFSSASRLLRNSMNLDGVLFFGTSTNAPDGGMYVYQYSPLYRLARADDV